MDNRRILEIAMAQSAVDLNCRAEDFERAENVIVFSEKNPEARKYLELPFDCNLVTYGSNIVASVRPQYRELIESYLDRCDVEHCFETPGIHILDEALEPYGLQTCFMAEYFLPDLDRLKMRDCGYELRILKQKDFGALYQKEWSNALCEKRKELDVLGIGAYDGGRLVGLAGCSADCGAMWQIGVDVLPEYRRRGIASALTGRLAWEILKRDKVPFYCCAWCNVKSAKNAIDSGFKPAWMELTVKSREFVEKMNGLGGR